MAGIVAALVLGTINLLWVLQRAPVPSERMGGVNVVMDAVHVLGNAAVVIAALASLGGNRRAHAFVRGLSKGMIAAITAYMLFGWWMGARAEAAAGSDVPPWFMAALVLLGTAFLLAPWTLYLLLFRAPRRS